MRRLGAYCGRVQRARSKWWWWCKVETSPTVAVQLYARFERWEGGMSRLLLLRPLAHPSYGFHCTALHSCISSPFFFFGLPRYCLICADRSPALLWCYYCGERGHISDNCPDMKKRDRVTLPRDNRRPHKSNRFDRFDAREDRYSKKPYRKR